MTDTFAILRQKDDVCVSVCMCLCVQIGFGNLIVRLWNSWNQLTRLHREATEPLVTSHSGPRVAQQSLHESSKLVPQRHFSWHESAQQSLEHRYVLLPE